jgi:hypothetical protein
VGKFYQQKEGMAMGNSLPPIVSNIFVEHSEDTADHKPAKWLRYVENTFVVWPHRPARLQRFLHDLNNVRPSNLRMKVEVNETLQFLDVLVTKRGSKLAEKVYRKPTHIGRYLHFQSNHAYHVRRGVAYSLSSRAKVICQDKKNFNNEIKNVRHDLMLKEYPQEFVDSVMKPPRSNHPSSDTIYQGTVIIPYVKGISEKLRRVRNRINVRTIFKTKHVLRGTLMKT